MKNSAPANRAMPERILLIDENERGMCARKTILEERGYHVTAVPCGVQGLRHFCADPYDLVVTGYNVPSAIELIVSLREHNPTIPIVLISGFAEVLGLDAANTGADVVIQKNCYEVSTLTRCVERLLARRTKRTVSVRWRSARRFEVVSQPSALCEATPM